MERCYRRLGFKSGIIFPAEETRGGLCLAWKDGFSVELQSYSKNHVDVIVQATDTNSKWRLTRFYGSPDVREKTVTWNLLRSLRRGSNLSWKVFADFNDILYSNEKKDGLSREERRMKDFRNALDHCSLVDLGFVRLWFTWERDKFQSTNIREHLDRCVANNDWLTMFPSYSIKHLPHSFSDHCPILIKTTIDIRRTTPKPFRFESW